MVVGSRGCQSWGWRGGLGRGLGSGLLSMVIRGLLWWWFLRRWQGVVLGLVVVVVVVVVVAVLWPWGEVMGRVVLRVEVEVRDLVVVRRVVVFFEGVVVML